MSWPALTDLELLTKIAELGSLSKAAAACGMAQPNASRAIARLERKLGEPLIMRSATGSKLTSTGALIVQWADPVLASATQFNLAVASLTENHNLTVMASQTVAECYAPQWLAKFHSEFPNITVRMTVNNSSVIMDEILAGHQELGLIESVTIKPGLNALPIGTDQLTLIVNPAHPWARRKSPIELSRLASTPLVVREPGSGTREVLDIALAEYDPVEPELEVSSNAAVIGSVIAGLAPAVISDRAANAAIANRSVVAVPVTNAERLQRKLHAVWLADCPLSEDSTEFLKLIV